ncbi:LysR substrate-binding domain-containing protein [Rhizosaccharibacter radicis]|uniref:LysR substrate-binding domain-containing protein n=1 Tax=Rhizosaccharibacter radicis TaxID=2782605 RepID=A0ABT1VXV7_9PROT|nr:LysR substrate-binding domain-containing protein [Acetobacteraceae bacterium KSS12]
MEPSMKELPPTPTLRAFEAAVRHPSFTAAAAELNVTQSAVSHQIRFLEQFWGLPLFERGRPSRPTPAGAALAPVIRQFLIGLDATLAGLRAHREREPLRISLTQSFASRWLLPRLPGFAERHPEIQLRIDEATDRPIRFGPDEADLAVRLGGSAHPGLHAELLLREHVFPVASPVLLRRSGMPAVPADLLRFPLLHRGGSGLIPRWEDWFDAAGTELRLPPPPILYPDANMTIEAALAGHGIALVRSAHVEQELRDGRLVRLLSVRHPSPLAYHLVCPRGRERLPGIRSFRNWIMAEAAVAQRLYDGAWV